MHGNLQQKNLFMADDLHVSPMAVLVGITTFYFVFQRRGLQWAAGPKPT